MGACVAAAPPLEKGACSRMLESCDSLSLTPPHTASAGPGPAPCGTSLRAGGLPEGGEEDGDLLGVLEAVQGHLVAQILHPPLQPSDLLVLVLRRL